MPIPSGVPRIDRDHPLARGLEFCAGPYSAWVDLVRGIRPSSNPAGAHVVDAYGRSSTTDGTNQIVYPSTATAHLNFTSQPFSVLWVAAIPVSSGVYPIGVQRATYTSESVNVGWTFVDRADGDSRPGLAFQTFANNGVAVYAANSVGAAAITLNKPFVGLGVSSGASTQQLYINGLRVGTSSSPNPLSAGSVALTIGGNATVLQSHVAIWSRALSANEAAMLNDPFCFFRSDL